MDGEEIKRVRDIIFAPTLREVKLINPKIYFPGIVFIGDVLYKIVKRDGDIVVCKELTAMEASNLLALYQMMKERSI